MRDAVAGPAVSPRWRPVAEAAFDRAYPWTTGGAWLVYALWVLGASAVRVLAVRR
ncbi:hypothetical protein [Streptomyces sp. NPDC003327]